MNEKLTKSVEVILKAVAEEGFRTKASVGEKERRT